MGLLEALKQYASDAAGGSLNPEIGNTLSGLLNYGKDRARYIGGLLDDSSPINQDLQNWHKRTQLGLADLIAGKEGPQADYGYSQLMNMVGVAPLGITAWHGSPHKFVKFSLDKIGTGEGAQAYGHGLYLAESPEVAQSYQSTVRNISGQNDRHLYAFGKSNKWDIQKTKEDIERAIGFVKDDLKTNPADASAKDALNQYTDLLSNLSNESLLKVKGDGQLYKTDIPDEAVARFLDWDKKLSEQAPEVQAAIGLDKNPNASIKDMTGLEFYIGTGGKLGEPTSASKAAAEHLLKKGIPGIRYLDGGSRFAGQGSSNFVVFDPEMIRILERNGQPTGLEPWKPGEYRLGDLLK